jgi:murein hydrolase activator
MHFGTPGRRRLGFASRLTPLRLAAAVLLVLLRATSVADAAEHPEADAKKAEEQLQAVKSEIERVTREVSAEQVERDRLTHELRTAELSVGKARDNLSDLRRDRAEGAARRAALTTEKRARETQLDQNRAALAGQLRAAYLIGRQEPLKLLLNQQDPALAGRMFVYYSYFGHARAGQIRLIVDDVERLSVLESELEAEDEKLAQLEKQ